VKGVVKIVKGNTCTVGGCGDTSYDEELNDHTTGANHSLGQIRLS
jgi:hypothetical protein